MRIVDSKAQQVQPFQTALQAVPISSNGPSFGSNGQASFTAESEYSPESPPYSDQAQSFFGQDNSNGYQEQQESNYPEEAGQAAPNIPEEDNNLPQGFEGLRGATYQTESDRGTGSSFEGNILSNDNNVF